MTKTKFICEDDNTTFLELGLNGSIIDFYISKFYRSEKDVLKIEEESVAIIQLTIEDAERLIDEIHRFIIKAEKEVKNG